VDETGAVRVGGKVTNPGGTEKLHEYWVHGPGAAKIRWGSPGDFDRCVMHLGKFIADPKGYCAKAHHDALGIWPATHAAMEHKAGRADMAKQDVMDRPAAPAASRGGEYTRMYPLENIEILRSEQSGPDGKRGVIVEAYAAVFDQPAEIMDQEGHYIEEIDRASFDTAIAFAQRNTGGLAANVKVLYNHGLTIQGTPAPEFQLPLGVPVDIKPESRGLLTRTSYDTDDPFTERVIGKIRQGAITAQSFTGRIIRSDPQLRRGQQHRPDSAGSLRTVRRLKLGLREYGPVLWPAYSGAEILGVRMSIPGGVPDADDELDDATALPPDEGPALAGIDPLAEGEHSARYHQHALYALRSREEREKRGLVW
jgi:phage head maturation protease